MNNKEHYIPGVIIGGVAAGFLSAIPFINWVNCCFCAWVIGGGVVAFTMVQKKAGVVPEPGEGAVIGAIAGVVAGLLSGGINFLLTVALDYNPVANMPGDNPAAGVGSLGMAFGSLCIQVIIFPIFAAGGGALGSVIFKKKAEQGGGGPDAGGGFGGPPPSQGGFGQPPQQGGGFGQPPQQGFGGPQQGGGFGAPPQGGGGFPPPGGGQPPQGGGGFPPQQ